MIANLITLKFNPQWILRNQTAGTSKVVKNSLESILKKFYIKDYLVIDLQFNRLEMLCVSDDPPLQKDILDLLKNEIDNIDDTAEMEVDITDMNSDGIKELISNIDFPLDPASVDLLKREFNVDVPKIVAEKSDAAQKQKSDKGKSDAPAPAEEKDLEIDSLIGLEPLKKWVSEINSLKGRYFDFAKQTGVIDNTAFLFSIDSGNGLSKIIEIMAKTLEKIGYGDFGGGKSVKEYKLIYDADRSKFGSYGALADIIKNSYIDVNNPEARKKMILAISFENWIDKIYDERLDALFKQLLTCKNIIYVFTIPYVEGVVANRVYDRLNDMFHIRYMRFKSPTMNEYFQHFKNKVNKYDIAVEEDAYDAFARKIIEEKNDGRFYGYKTVNKIVTEVLYSILLNSVKENVDIQKTITKRTLEDLYAIDDAEVHSGLEQLNGMIALDEVKKQVLEMVSTAKLQKKLYLQGSKTDKPCLHMMFTGNPGTGKTVVARLVGKILKEEGVLSVGNFFEVTRQDLVGQYVGQTAPKTMDICRNEYGSVLFIDEAYMLANDKETYGSEAIGTLISEMENNRDNMVVIFAGYKDKMEELFEINAGLKDRIPYIINFPNYSRGELKEIFFKQLSDKVKYEDGFSEAVGSFFESIPDELLNDDKFSNGRFVRNLLEKIVSKASLRFDMSESDISEFRLTANDLRSATEQQHLNELSEKIDRRIGF